MKKHILVAGIFILSLAGCKDQPGVNGDGTCNATFVESYNSISSEIQSLSNQPNGDIDAVSANFKVIESHCDEFNANYSSVSCIAKDVKSGNQVTVSSEDISPLCDKIKSLLSTAAGTQAALVTVLSNDQAL